MKFFLVNNETAAANSLMKKMANEARTGGLIACTREEFDSYVNGDFQLVTMSEDKDNRLIEVDPAKKYILFADENMNLDSVVDDIELTGLDIGIIRTY